MTAPHRILAAQIERDLRAVAQQALRHLASPDVIGAVRGRVIGMLLAHRNAGDIPPDFDFTATSVTIKGSDLAIALPVRLRLFLERGHETLRPHYQHDCAACLFLGHIWGSDLYFCKRATGSTVIARQSDDPSHYLSGLAMALVAPVDDTLRLASDLAREDLLIAMARSAVTPA